MVNVIVLILIAPAVLLVALINGVRRLWTGAAE